MSEYVTEVQAANFKTEVLESSVPVLVDFYAPWCGPCKMLAPTVEQIAREYAGTLRVVKVNTDEAPEIANEYRVMSIPTLILFKGGQPVSREVGLQPADRLRQLIDLHLK
jgi:thioredoxin 1